MKTSSNINWKEINEKIKKAKSALKEIQKSGLENTTEILRKRAEAMALSEDQDAKNKRYINIIEFTLGQEKYAIQTQELQEVLNSNQIIEIPCTPSHIYGVINLRGKIVSILDLKKYLQLDYVGINDQASVIICTYNKDLVGIVADSISGIKNIEAEKVQTSNPKFKKIKENFIYGITNETVIILNIKNILSEKNIIVNEEYI